MATTIKKRVKIVLNLLSILESAKYAWMESIRENISIYINEYQNMPARERRQMWGKICKTNSIYEGAVDRILVDGECVIHWSERSSVLHPELAREIRAWARELRAELLRHAEKCYKLALSE